MVSPLRLNGATLKTIMRRTVICTLLTLGALTFATSQGDRHRVVKLPVEERTILHIGDFAIAPIPSDFGYHVDLAGNPLLPARLSGHRGELVYRAVSVGLAALVLSPVVPRGQCISCKTIHYFVQVEP